MAMQLTRAERAELAKELLESLDDGESARDEGDIEAAWLAEVDRRIEKIENGTARFESWDVVRARLQARVRPVQP